MRALVIDDEAKAKVARVVEYAAAHPFNPNRGDDTAIAIPGRNPQHVIELSSYRCVFTNSYFQKHGLFRHLSISVPSADYPNPYATWSIAELFGFTGWDGHSAMPPGDWVFHINKDEHCITVAQKL